MTLAQEWDPAGRLTAQAVTADGAGDANLPHRVYRYGPQRHPTNVADRLGGDSAFTLDPVGRVSAVSGEWNERYTYDAAGNVTHAAWPGGRTDRDARVRGRDTGRWPVSVGGGRGRRAAHR